MRLVLAAWTLSMFQGSRTTYRVSATFVSDRWNLLWRDEFTGSQLNQKRWTAELGDGCQYLSEDYPMCGWGNGELVRRGCPATIAAQSISAGNNQLQTTVLVPSWHGDQQLLSAAHLLACELQFSSANNFCMLEQLYLNPLGSMPYRRVSLF